MFYQLFYQCSINVLSMFYQCSFNVLSMFYQCSNVLSMFYQCSINFYPILEHYCFDFQKNEFYALCGFFNQSIFGIQNGKFTRVDLHRPKMLIIQFHTLSLWKNASHTNFIHFCKMSLIEFQRYFIVVLVSKLVSLH